jgi:hypothetical protein
MGTDFLRNKKERFSKAWRHGVAQTESDWLASTPRVTRVFRAKSDGPCTLAANQPVLLRLVADNQVVASSGVALVATLVKPSTALLEQLRGRQGVGTATVQRVSAASCRVDLLVEE